ncbi:CatB-related O-acetyltransferase [Aestuariibius sp. HNIBRBA575]|uniref:CatB-related O-acetyltransferase n=1 Tax=Aestuariibius sp. HNIBRBA575 TaxID=3233343 RepID=UPI0034A4B00A
MTTNFPNPGTRHPITLPDGQGHVGTVFLKPAIDHPRFHVGDYTYASAFAPPEDWAACLAPYLFAFSPEKLVIGRFCQIADGAMFITSSANHRYDGFSTYPFAIFDGGAMDGRPSMPEPGRDTVIGNDVWIGQGARIMPGAQIADGCIVGAGAVVSGNVAPYSSVAGNPAQTIRSRFDPETIAALLDIQWWHWPIEVILKNEAAICGADLAALQHIANAV